MPSSRTPTFDKRNTVYGPERSRENERIARAMKRKSKHNLAGEELFCQNWDTWENFLPEVRVEFIKDTWPSARPERER